jgi:hypothetical protein
VPPRAARYFLLESTKPLAAPLSPRFRTSPAYPAGTISPFFRGLGFL